MCGAHTFRGLYILRWRGMECLSEMGLPTYKMDFGNFNANVIKRQFFLKFAEWVSPFEHTHRNDAYMLMGGL